MSGSRQPAVPLVLPANWQQKQKSVALGRLNASGLRLRRVMLVFQDLKAHRFSQAQTPSLSPRYQNRQMGTLMLLCAMAVLLPGLMIMRLNHHQAMTFRWS